MEGMAGLHSRYYNDMLFGGDRGMAYFSDIQISNNLERV
jgi:hypothetical protein